MQVYVETSVWSFAFADDAPDYRNATLLFFDECRAGKHDPAISLIVLEEIGRTGSPKRELLESLVQEISPVLLPVTPRALQLADAFVRYKAVPASKPDDARHVAVAIAEAVPVLISWNFKHIANVRRAIQRRRRTGGLRAYTSYREPAGGVV